MKTRTKLIALAGVVVASTYVVNKIKYTQDLKPSIGMKLPESKTVLPKVSPKCTLSKTMIQSFISQITEMMKTLDPQKEITLIHYLATDEKQTPVIDVILVAAGYEKISESIHSKFKKSVPANAQAILDEVIFVAQTAKSHKRKYLGWDLGS